jgi:hypothetical protein
MRAHAGIAAITKQSGQAPGGPDALRLQSPSA